MGGGGDKGGSGSGLDVLNQLSQQQSQLSQQDQQYYQSLMGQNSAIGIGSGGGGQPSWGSSYSQVPPYMSSLGGFDASQFAGIFGQEGGDVTQEGIW